ncbi:MAG: hypothetical protein EOO43_11850 [Flavobacterium sp.]|nr:MAG: hypothetical protein EOO43_11850 [Flavobacterium sp.]
MLDYFIYMGTQNWDTFSIIIVITTIVMILGMGIPFLMALYFRRRKIHEEEKRLLNLSFESELLKTQIEAQEQTMKTIAADLHDNIGQLLSLTSLTLSTINLDHRETTKEKIDESRSLIRKSIKDLRHLAKVMHGEQLSNQGIVHIMQQEIRRLKQSGTFILTFNTNLGEEMRFSPKKDLVLMRILQELLNNIIKHAHATTIDLSATLINEILCLKVIDNGIGFEPNAISEMSIGLGLHSVKNRVSLLQGILTIKSEPTIGTTIKIEIPYP